MLSSLSFVSTCSFHEEQNSPSRETRSRLATSCGAQLRASPTMAISQSARSSAPCAAWSSNDDRNGGDGSSRCSGMFTVSMPPPRRMAQ